MFSDYSKNGLTHQENTDNPLVLYEFDDPEAKHLTSCAMICVKKPRAKVSYWDKQEPPAYSASLAVFNASDNDSYIKALSYYKSESEKDNKLTYFVINNDTFNEVDSLITSLKSEMKATKFSNDFIVDL